MKKILDSWAVGVDNLFFGYAISLYSYLSIVLSGIFYIWNFKLENALSFTILSIISFCVICICGILKCRYSFSKMELIIARMYLISMIILWIIGCFINFALSFMLLVLPVLFAGIMVLIRDFQAMKFVNSEYKIVKFITKLFYNSIIWIISFIFCIISPVAVFFCILYNTLTSVKLIMVILILYFIFLPFIIWIEVSWLKGTMFDVAFSVAWNKKEQVVMQKSLDSLNDDEFMELIEKYEDMFIDNPELATELFFEELERNRSNYQKFDK